MGGGQSEAEIQYEIRLALSREPDVVLWRNTTGVATHGTRTVRYGLARGGADLIGIGPDGRFLALEIKTATGRLSDEQSLFLALVRRRGGFAAVVTSVHEALAAVARARSGEVA